MVGEGYREANVGGKEESGYGEMTGGEFSGGGHAYRGGGKYIMTIGCALSGGIYLQTRLGGFEL